MAVSKVGVHGEAARIDLRVFLRGRALGDRDAGGLAQHVLDGVQALVFHLLARDDADGLRRFAQRQVQLGGAGRSRVGLGVFRLAVAQRVGADGDFGQGGGIRGGNRTQHIAVRARGVAGQAGVLQQAVHAGSIARLIPDSPA
ncbi:hypothetical protein G6F62_014281 [Rhizopus arrhizus]|nr:hypothetical protein G6F62_014281 [Rhizopus arrhizus]